MGDKIICKNCGNEFDPAKNTSTACRYHPEEGVFLSTADSRYDYADVYRYPCCGQTEFYGYSGTEPVLGCRTGFHEARG